MRETTTASPEETVAFGRSLGAELKPPLLVLLRGDLGAGKTTLVKGIAEGFGAASQHDVTSPTFTLIHDDLIAENSILLIEWGEKFPHLQRDRDLEITLERVGEAQRRIRLNFR